MTYPSKIVLQVPVSDDSRLRVFIEECLKDKVALIAVVGDGCEEIEDLIDDILVGDGSDATRFIVTTSYPDRSVDEAVEFVRHWKMVRTDEPDVVKL
ncbi:hypothetical protein ACFSM5_14940 [Lacibacterium aquatile]|uniref:Uncharacterized protein n=1 Tax=Lacibacterium aquatile TaxID=1168082 RepID=A0ABW5DW51_9PROT